MKTIELKHSFKINIESTTIIIENIQHRLIDKNIHTHSHGEQCYEIHYVQRGNGTLSLNNQKHSLEPGKMFMAGPYIKHALTPFSEECLDEYYVYFNIKKTPSPLSKERVEWHTLLSTLINTPAWFGEDKHNAAIIMNELLNSALKKELGYQTELKGLFLQFITRLTRNIMPEDYINTSTETNHASIHRVLENSFADFNISLEKIANELYLSPRQTERIIKNIYGKNFQQKKKEARMLAASDFLISSEKSVNEISELLGYSSIGHFSNQFKQYYGKTPSQFRMNL